MLINGYALTHFFIALVGAVELRHLQPPRLEAHNLGRRVICYRPLRHGSPLLAIERIAGKTVLHNAGLGGSGWTLGPGCVQHMIRQFEEISHGLVQPAMPIEIVGGGVVGLMTAYFLVKRGYQNITISAALFDDLTSHRAGGLIAPVSMDNDPSVQILLDQISIAAYAFYKTIADGFNEDFIGGARMMPAYFMTREDAGFDAYIGTVMREPRDVVVDFGNGTQRPMVEYQDALFVDTPLMMEQLTAFLRDKVIFIQRKITHFGQCAADYIFNCTGLGSGELLNDDQFVPVQGHLIMLKDQDKRALDYMMLVYFDATMNEHGQRVERSFYQFPKKDRGAGETDYGVIGGTFIEGATAQTPNEQEFELLVNRARNWFGLAGHYNNH